MLLRLAKFGGFFLDKEFTSEALDETSKADPRAKKLSSQDFVDRRYLDGLNKSGFFEKL